MRYAVLCLTAVLLTALPAVADDDQNTSGQRITPLRPGVHFDQERREALFELRALRRKGCLGTADALPRKQALDHADTAMRELEYVRIRLHTGTTPDDYQRYLAVLEQMQELDFLWKAVHELPDCQPATAAPQSSP